MIEKNSDWVDVFNEAKQVIECREKLLAIEEKLADLRPDDNCRIMWDDEAKQEKEILERLIKEFDTLTLIRLIMGMYCRLKT